MSQQTCTVSYHLFEPGLLLNFYFFSDCDTCYILEYIKIMDDLHPYKVVPLTYPSLLQHLNEVQLLIPHFCHRFVLIEIKGPYSTTSGTNEVILSKLKLCCQKLLDVRKGNALCQCLPSSAVAEVVRKRAPSPSSNDSLAISGTSLCNGTFKKTTT